MEGRNGRAELGERPTAARHPARGKGLIAAAALARAFSFSLSIPCFLLGVRRLSPVAFAMSSVPSRHCIYPGTFDPVTFGHLDVLERAARLFDRVTVAIADNPGKGPLFSSRQRLDLVRAVVAPFPNVEVTVFDGLLVEFARVQGAIAVIRGIRALSDFEFEFNMALMNRHLEPRLETIFVMPHETYSYTSSHLVKQVAKLGGDVSHFVPPVVSEALRAAFASPGT